MPTLILHDTNGIARQAGAGTSWTGPRPDALLLLSGTGALILRSAAMRCQDLLSFDPDAWRAQSKELWQACVSCWWHSCRPLPAPPPVPTEDGRSQNGGFTSAAGVDLTFPGRARHRLQQQLVRTERGAEGPGRGCMESVKILRKLLTSCKLRWRSASVPSSDERRDVEALRRDSYLRFCAEGRVMGLMIPAMQLLLWPVWSSADLTTAKSFY